MISFSTSDRFAHLTADDLDRLESFTKLDQFAPGEVVQAQGAPSEWLGIVCSGKLAFEVPGRDGPVKVLELAAGDLYGELETFAPFPQGARLVAVTDTLVRACPKNPLKQELRANRDLAVGMLFAYSRSMSEKIRQANVALATLRAGQPSVPPPTRDAQGDRPPHLKPDEVGWLSMLGRKEEAPESQAVVREGDTTRSFYVVESGHVEVRRGEGPEALALARFGPGDLFGILSFLDGQPRSASVVTVDGLATFTCIEEGAVETALKVNFSVAFRFLATLCAVLGRTFGDTAVEVSRA